MLREQLYGKENAKKSYALEDYVVSSIVDIIHSRGWTDEVDLVHGRHITVFSEDEEERKALVDYEDAQRGGLNLDGVEFLDRQTMLQVWLSSFVASIRTHSFGRHMVLTLQAYTPTRTISGPSNLFQISIISPLPSIRISKSSSIPSLP